MKRTLLIVLVACGLLWGSTACSTTDYIRAWFPDNYSKALAVAKCESGLNPRAISPGGHNWGLFQINRVHEPRVRAMGYTWNQMLDAGVNARVARKIYNEQGWGPWACG